MPGASRVLRGPTRSVFGVIYWTGKFAGENLRLRGTKLVSGGAGL